MITVPDDYPVALHPKEQRFLRNLMASGRPAEAIQRYLNTLSPTPPPPPANVTVNPRWGRIVR